MTFPKPRVEARHLAACWAVLSAALPAAPSVRAQGFGQNHVVLKDFDWRVRSTEHFDIHYYRGSEALVPQAAETLEDSYRRISGRLGVRFDRRKPFFLYASVNDFQQSNIVQAGDGTGGVTEAFKDRFLVYNDGSSQWLRDVITHELAHVFQFHVLVSGFWKSARILKSFVYPLWMMEGMAEHVTEGYDDTTEEVYVRDAATSGGLIPLWKLEHFSHLKPHQVTLAYKSGGTVLDFIAGQYGPEKVGRMLRLFESRFESNSVLQELVGLDIFAFDKKWREYLEEKYRREIRLQRLREPGEFGIALTTAGRSIPEFNTSPVFTPDARRMAYFSTRRGHPPVLLLKDLVSGKTRPLVADAYGRIENVPLGNFTNLSRVLAISPDSRLLAFTARKNHADSLYLYDLRGGGLRRLPLPGLMTASMPAFSPDGKKVAFSGMREGFTDIYLLDLATGEYEALTSDPQDDQSPHFSPDGTAIVYSSELRLPQDPMPFQRRLYRLRLADKSLEPLETLPGAARDPFYSPDGTRLLFALEREGAHDLYEMALADRRIRRLTRSIGGSYTPIYAPGGDIAFASFRGGQVHIYRGGREGFLDEPVDAPSGPLPREDLGELPGLGAASAAPASSSAPWSFSASSAPLLGPERPYSFSAGTDLFLPAFFYSSQGGLFWTSYWQGSDMLGSHQAGGFVAYNSGQGYLNYQTQYAYARYRPQLFANFSGLILRDAVDFSDGSRARESAHAQTVGLAYPFDRYHRVEFLARAVSESIAYPTAQEKSRQIGRVAGSAFVRDTVGGRYLVATRGSRLRLGVSKTAEVLGGNVSDYTSTAEGHQYVPTGGQSALALRGFVGGSWGRDSQQFALGGIGRLRGYAYSTEQNVGNRAALATAEWRFPITDLNYYMWYFFPDFYFKALTGAFFTDAGYAWSSRSGLSSVTWRDARRSYGAGLRIHTFILQLFPLVLHMDYARRSASGGSVFYVYLGPLF